MAKRIAATELKPGDFFYLKSYYYPWLVEEVEGSEIYASEVRPGTYEAGYIIPEISVDLITEKDELKEAERFLGVREKELSNPGGQFSVGTYRLYSKITGLPIRKATFVEEIRTGKVIRFIELIPKKVAIEQTKKLLRRKVS